MDGWMDGCMYVCMYDMSVECFSYIITIQISRIFFSISFVPYRAETVS